MKRIWQWLWGQRWFALGVFTALALLLTATYFVSRQNSGEVPYFYTTR